MQSKDMLFSLLLLIFLLSLSEGFQWPEEDCGISGGNSNASTTRIIGGFYAESGLLPWQAHISYRARFICGGSLIHSKWILTAAHCVRLREDFPRDFEVRLGEFDINVEEGTETRNVVEMIFAHPDYNHGTFDCDVALLKLKTTVTFGKYISPVCLAGVPNNTTELYPPNTLCATSGWGTIDPELSKFDSKLKAAALYLWSNEDCAGNMSIYQRITDNMICAGHNVTKTEDSTLCSTLGSGDSGGPLIALSERKRWTLLGVSSFAVACLPDRYTPNGFARVQALLGWIMQIAETNTE